MTQTEPTSVRPADIFLHLIVTFLTPMFLAAAGGDITHARMAAAETLATYGARTERDLLPIAHVIAFGLATLDSLNRSMNEALSTSVVLRLRANAANLNRAAEQCRRALRTPDAGQQAGLETGPPWEAACIPDREPLPAAEPSLPNPDPSPTTTIPPAGPLTTVQPITTRSTTQLTSGQTPTGPATTTQRTTAQSTSAQTTTQTGNRTAWATAMTDVARECTAGLANLPPAERRQASMRAAALSSVAQHLLSNQPLPPSPFDARFPLPPRRHS